MTTKPNPLVLLRDGVWWRVSRTMGTSYAMLAIKNSDTRIHQAIENYDGPHTGGLYEVVDEPECKICRGWCCHKRGTVPTLRKAEG